MIETTGITNTGALVMSHAAHAGEWGAGSNSVQRGANAEYYRAYYSALVTKRAERMERSRRHEAIKSERPRARRERWMQGIKSFARVFGGAEAVN
jgi:hypothetical protein